MDSGQRLLDFASWHEHRRPCAEERGIHQSGVQGNVGLHLRHGDGGDLAEAVSRLTVWRRRPFVSRYSRRDSERGFPMKARSVGLVALSSVACLTCFLSIGCTPTLGCGIWNFSGTPTGNSFPLTNTFT